MPDTPKIPNVLNVRFRYAEEREPAWILECSQMFVHKWAYPTCWLKVEIKRRLY